MSVQFLYFETASTHKATCYNVCRNKWLTKRKNRLSGHSLTDLPGVLLNKLDNSVVVFRSLIAKPS